MESKNYPIDIAISLCQEDLAYAKKLRQELNPKLDVYLYEERQDELLGKDGLVEFGKKFRDEARLVVVLYRSRWGETLYTGIEQEALLDRIKQLKDGPGFIVMIPMEGKEAPFWYPRSRIYADPERFSPEQIARWVEFKFQEKDGIVEPLTLEDKIEYFKEKERQKVDHIRFLHSKSSGQGAEEELKALMDRVNEKIEVVEAAQLRARLRVKKFTAETLLTRVNTHAELAIDQHRVVFIIKHLDVTNVWGTSLAFSIVIERSSIAGQGDGQRVWQGSGAKKYMFNTDGNQLNGWSPIREVSSAEYNSKPHLYFNTTEIYDLGPIIPTAELVEKQFIWLFEQMENGYKKLLNL